MIFRDFFKTRRARVRVSVWMTACDQAAYVTRAVESVLSQTRPPDELVIVDDASTDGTTDLLKTFRKKSRGRIRYRRNSIRQGITAAKNSALREATGDFVSWLDGDDAFKPKKIEQDLKALEAAPEAGFAVSDVEIIDAAGEIKGHWPLDLFPEAAPADRCGSAGEAILNLDLHSAHCRNETVRRAILSKVGGFDPRVTLWQDWDFRIRLSALCPAVYCPATLQQYRLHGHSASSASDPELQTRDLLYLYRKHRAAFLSGAGEGDSAGSALRALTGQIARHRVRSLIKRIPEGETS